ncbi:chorismate mutase [Sedimentibacter sp. MB31-C6]|uniref:chorismate mutase n=1 Tax=Sedimentibacter sp. MB31-C6 TaxID=3109366 RepID=UPI002DDCC30B|nr:chorismate mutase [Sedimentibacter sp. MB36-C1]WSI05345.1 chorismate mutase [Sedimentibacter sp. MB36-C1]
MELEKMRNEINELDKEIVRLLEKRFNLVLKVGKFKKDNKLPVLDEKRENLILKKCNEHLTNKEYSNYIHKIYIQIMNTCKDIQKAEKDYINE